MRSMFLVYLIGIFASLGYLMAMAVVHR